MSQTNAVDTVHTFWVEKGSFNAVEVVGPDGLGVYSGKTREQLEEKWGRLEVMSSDELRARTYEQACTAPERTTLENWEYSLNVLPPMNWRRRGHTESFMISEAWTADVHPVFVRIGSDYFSFQAPRSRSHDELVKQVREHFKLDH